MTTAMPDFDNMTPEQISEWMESLARRQGATEGFTTAASMDVPQIDPSTVEQSLLEDTYIPFGWKQEEWQAQLDKEAREKATRQTAAPVLPPAPVRAPVAAPVAQAVPAVPAAPVEPGITMSEQELTDFIIGLPLEKQLELLEEMGKQQRGEPNRVSDLMPKLDESTVDHSKITKYVPFGWKEEDWDAHLLKEEAAKQAAPVPAVAAVISTPIEDVGDVLKAPSLDDLFAPQPEVIPQPAAALEDPMSWLTQLGGSDSPTATNLPSVSFEELNRGLSSLSNAAASDDPMSWLADLQGLAPSASTGDVNALDTELFNLGNLARMAEAPPTATADDDMNWLESIARAGGADTQELATPANSVIQRPGAVVGDGPGYQPYSFENSRDADHSIAPVEDDLYHEMTVPDVNSFDDPESWLDKVAEGVNHQREDNTPPPAEEPFTDPMEVMRALNAGSDVSPQVMETFFEQMFERAEQVVEEPTFDTENTPPIAAEIPDWLQESFASVTPDTAAEIPVSQMLQDLGLTEEEFGDTSPLVDSPVFAPSSLDWQLDTTDGIDPVEMELDEIVTLDDLPITGEIPAWLLDTAIDSPEDMSDIFADANPLQDDYLEATSPVTAVRMDTSDPWVRAFAEENNQKNDLDAWYTQSVASLTQTSEEEAVVADDVRRPAANAASIAGTLQPANLPYESLLMQALPVDIPSWLVSEDVTVEPIEINNETWFDTFEEVVPASLQNQINEDLEPSGALPDWLAGVEDVPDWLRETIEEKPAPAASVVVPILEAPAPVIMPQKAVAVVSAAPVPASSPVSVPAAARIDVAATLQSARNRAASNMDDSLRDYESIVRANAALPEVVQDLKKVISDSAHKTNSAAHRVLGDALMRQGNLQEALATYRKALNLL